MQREKVLFFYAHNSARSQMADAWLRRYTGERFEVYSEDPPAYEGGEEEKLARFREVRDRIARRIREC